ncbi:MAG: hypothetical protein IT320_03985 [Anaerolineae bacterium]|nr:hypothetical protein [Anaerolineae bacterium]
MLDALTTALGAPRDVLATDDQIEHVWNNLPRLLSRIPSELRDEGLVRLCVSVAAGLFDSAINYAWNAAIIELREKVRRFGINIIPQITGHEFDESKLLDLKDSELLSLCLKLNLISVDGFFMLDQCRDIRNNFSSAHPTIGQLDEDEVLTFLSRVSRFALNDLQNPRAVNIQDLIAAVKESGFSTDQLRVWCERIENTYDAQREIIFGMLYGIYCDPNQGEHVRTNSISVCRNFVAKFTPGVRSLLINRHQEYQAKGETERHKASLLFFENLSLLTLLSESERHSMISSACKTLLSVHNAFDNFYNEPPFAERLLNLTASLAVPITTQTEFVETVITCSVGNRYGTSNAADVYYVQMIEGFSPRELQIMLELPRRKTVVAERIASSSRCKNKYAQIVRMIKPESVPTSLKTLVDKWTKP